MNIPTTRLGLRPRPFIWVLLLGCILAYPLAPAVSSPSGDKRDYILVINTYAESTPWSRGIITDITARVEQIENLELYTEHINLLLVDSPREIETFETNLLREYGKKPPRALVLIGTPTALLRNFINSIWKGIPTIVCAEQDFVGPDKYYQKRLPIPASEPGTSADTGRPGQSDPALFAGLSRPEYRPDEAHTARHGSAHIHRRRTLRQPANGTRPRGTARLEVRRHKIHGLFGR